MKRHQEFPKDLPWFAIFARDELADPGLALIQRDSWRTFCRIRAVAWLSSDRGYLDIGGRAMTLEEIAASTHLPVEEVDPAIRDLFKNGVLQARDDDGAFFWPPMVRDIERQQRIHEVRAAAGRAGMEKRWGQHENADNKSITKHNKRDNNNHQAAIGDDADNKTHNIPVTVTVPVTVSSLRDQTNTEDHHRDPSQEVREGYSCADADTSPDEEEALDRAHREVMAEDADLEAELARRRTS